MVCLNHKTEKPAPDERYDPLPKELTNDAICSTEFNSSKLAFDDEIFDSKALYGNGGSYGEPKFCRSRDLLWTGLLYFNNSWWFRDVRHPNEQKTTDSSSSYNAMLAFRTYVWNSTANQNEFIKIDLNSAEKYAKEYNRTGTFLRNPTGGLDRFRRESLKNMLKSIQALNR